MSNIFHHPPYCCLNNENENSNPSYDQSMYMLLSLGLHKSSSTTSFFEKESEFLEFFSGVILLSLPLWSHGSSHHQGITNFSQFWNWNRNSQIQLSHCWGGGKHVILKVFYLILCGFVQWYLWQNTVRNQTELEFLFHKPK